MIIFICSNGTWKALKYLYLGYNPAVLEATDALKAIEDITSKSLEQIDLPGKFGAGITAIPKVYWDRKCHRITISEENM